MKNLCNNCRNQKVLVNNQEKVKKKHDKAALLAKSKLNIKS